MTDRVTLYRVRRPDGTVIPAPPRDHRYAAVVSASYSEPQLSNLILAADEDQKFDDYLKITGYTVEAVEYAPVNAEREKEMERLIARNKKLELCGAKMNEEICQILGKALGYPWPKDDPKNFPGATEADGVCAGEHVAESIAEEAARRIRKHDNPEREAAIRTMRELFDMALDEWSYAAQYKGDYLREKHGDDEEIAKCRDAIAAFDKIEEGR